jgi:acyl-coenzyme A thioesterase PaaI-like protein
MKNAMDQSLQDRYAPENRCFGCGPANEKGLRIKSYEEGDVVVARWQPEKHHEAYGGMLSGGIIGALLDCHSNWAAVVHLMRATGSEDPPCTVTSQLEVRYLRPTPTKDGVVLKARVTGTEKDRATVEATLEAGGKVTATSKAVFVAVKEGHPAWNRW